MRMGILVSKTDHCLTDLLYRCRSGELDLEIACVVSNHPDQEALVKPLNIPYRYSPVSKENTKETELEILEIIRDNTDFIVLARYMQILSAEFLDAYGKDVINIHHSFLPSFKGANPYQQAYDRGVKVIGATAHYVTQHLDEGPIIEQIVEKVTHRDHLEDLKRKSRNLEKAALANAIQAHIEHRIIRFQNKTIVFG